MDLLDAKTAKTYEKLKEIRKRTDLKLKPTPYLKDTFTGFDGEEHPLTIRYYQVPMVTIRASARRWRRSPASATSGRPVPTPRPSS
jgi:hypothetical protein